MQGAREAARPERPVPARPRVRTDLPGHAVLELQRQAGNAAVGRLVAQRCGDRPCACPTTRQGPFGTWGREQIDYALWKVNPVSPANPTGRPRPVASPSAVEAVDARHHRLASPQRNPLLDRPGKEIRAGLDAMAVPATTERYGFTLHRRRVERDARDTCPAGENSPC